MKLMSQAISSWLARGLFLTLPLATCRGDAATVAVKSGSPPASLPTQSLGGDVSAGTGTGTGAGMLLIQLEATRAEGAAAMGVGTEAARLAAAAAEAVAMWHDDVGRQDDAIVGLGGPLGKALGGFADSVPGLQRNINKTHRVTQEKLDNLTQGVHTVCSEKLFKDMSPKKAFKTAARDHRQCRKDESSAQQCESQRAALTKAKVAACDDVMILKQAPQLDCAVTEGYQAWLEKKLAFFEDLDEKIKAANKKCDTEEQKLDSHGECASSSSTLKIKCDGHLALAERYACLWASGDLSCNEFTTCYKEQEKSFNASLHAAKEEEASLKLQWRLTQRLRCLLGAMTPGGAVDKAALNKCVGSSLQHSTGHLNFTYPNFPAPRNCSHPNVGLGTEAFKLAVHSDLPDDLKVRDSPSACSQKVEFIVRSMNDHQFYKCTKEKCEKWFQSKKPIQRMTVGSGQFFLMVNQSSTPRKGDVLRCRKDDATQCKLLLTGEYPLLTHWKNATSFYLFEGKTMKKCDLEPFQCEDLFSDKIDPLSLAVGQDGEFVMMEMGADLSSYLKKCSHKGKCDQIDKFAQQFTVRVDTNGDYLVVVPRLGIVSKCPPGKGCSEIMSFGKGTRPEDVLPETNSYLVAFQKDGIKRCPRKTPNDCERVFDVENARFAQWPDSKP